MIDLTTTEAAARLGIGPRRVRQMIEAGQLEGRAIPAPGGQVWLVDRASVDRRAIVQEAQKAWELLRIPNRLWGSWYLGDPDEIQTFKCPQCGKLAFSPAGGTKYSDRAACPSCGWIAPST